MKVLILFIKYILDNISKVIFVCLFLKGTFIKFPGYLHGTRGFINQLHENINLDITIRSESDKMIDMMIDFRMKAFMAANIPKKRNFLDACIVTNLQKLQPKYQVLLSSKLKEINHIETFAKAIINKKGNLLTTFCIKLSLLSIMY